MLSPKATNLVRLILAGAWTTTAKLQVSARWRLSVAVQDTAVVPMPNWAPLAGAQLVATGATPPTTVALP
jgi:hypothetical protein